MLAVFPVHAQKTVKVNFNSTDDCVESDDVKGAPTKSSLSADLRKKVIANIQKAYDDAVGKGKVTVSEGKGGDADVTISGRRAPGVNKGKEYGDAGKQPATSWAQPSTTTTSRLAPVCWTQTSACSSASPSVRSQTTAACSPSSTLPARPLRSWAT